jgi:hypothetical protein
MFIENDVLIEIFVVKEVDAKLVLEVVVDCAVVGSQLVEKIGCGLTRRIHHGVLLNMGISGENVFKCGLNINPEACILIPYSTHLSFIYKVVKSTLYN